MKYKVQKPKYMLQLYHRNDVVVKEKDQETVKQIKLIKDHDNQRERSIL